MIKCLFDYTVDEKFFLHTDLIWSILVSDVGL
jgi:hypothetical protein